MRRHRVRKAKIFCSLSYAHPYCLCGERGEVSVAMGYKARKEITRTEKDVEEGKLLRMGGHEEGAGK